MPTAPAPTTMTSGNRAHSSHWARSSAITASKFHARGCAMLPLSAHYPGSEKNPIRPTLTIGVANWRPIGKDIEPCVTHIGLAELAIFGVRHALQRGRIVYAATQRRDDCPRIDRIEDQAINPVVDHRPAEARGNNRQAQVPRLQLANRKPIGQCRQYKDIRVLVKLPGFAVRYRTGKIHFRIVRHIAGYFDAYRSDDIEMNGQLGQLANCLEQWNHALARDDLPQKKHAHWARKIKFTRIGSRRESLMWTIVN